MALKQSLCVFAIFLAACIVAIESVNLCEKFEPNYDPDSCVKKSCPLERLVDGVPNFCKANTFQYKCGAFFKNLPGRVDVTGAEIIGDTLTWVTALPDMLRKTWVQNNDAIKDTFGNLEEDDFRFKGDSERAKCHDGSGPKVGNARCYAAMHRSSKYYMDDCAFSALNEEGNSTIGNILCRNLDFFYDRGDFVNKAKPDSIRDVEISFRYSICGGEWNQIADNYTLPDGTVTSSEPLECPEKLCCQRDDDGEFKFERCDGSSFSTVCV